MSDILQQVTVGQFLLVFGLCAGAALIGSIVLFIIAGRQVAEIDVPPDADFFETLQLVPITVPIALDLLDMAFDFFAAPIAWVILELLGLKSLQMITVFEGILPGTQLIPTMTLAWIVARMMKDKRRTEGREMLHEYQQQMPALPLQRDHTLADRYRSRTLLPEQTPSESHSPPNPPPSPTPSTGTGDTKRSKRSDEVVEGEFYEEDYVEPPPGYYGEEDEPW